MSRRRCRVRGTCPAGLAARGFTLIELLVAAAIGLFVTFAALALLFQAAHVADTSISKVRMNDEARLVFRMLLDGGVADKDGDGVIGAGEAIRGIHATSPTDPVSGSCLAGVNVQGPVPNDTRVRLRDPDLADPADLVSSTLGGPITIECFAQNDPIDACTNAGDAQQVNGFVSAMTVANAPPVADGDLLALRLTVVDPSRLVLAGAAERAFLQREHTEEYRFLAACQRF